MARFLIVVLVVLATPATRSWAQSQKAAVCQGSCGGGCGPCAGGADNQAANSAPAQPSAWLRNRDQILESRGVKAYDRCVADFGRADFDGAIDECRHSVDAYVDAFGSKTSARAVEASQALAAAENARAAALFHRGNCDAAAAMFRSAAEHDPSTSAYGRNAAMFTASACAAAAGARTTAARPPPPPTFVESSPVPLPSDISSPALATAKDSYHHLSPWITDYVAHHVPGGEFAAQIQESAEMRKQYNQLARDLVDEATGAATETVSILGGGEGSIAHVVDAPDRMAHMVNQYVSDQIADLLAKKTRAWVIGHVVP